MSTSQPFALPAPESVTVAYDLGTSGPIVGSQRSGSKFQIVRVTITDGEFVRMWGKQLLKGGRVNHAAIATTEIFNADAEAEFLAASRVSS